MAEGHYNIPAEGVCVEQEIKRSRFIADVGRARDEQEAKAFIDQVRVAHPDATHHCWAYIAGNPHDTTQIGMSDDGEPQGTAGKPMLSILKYSGVGEIVAVVTRYFGGTKLGTGGLVRAYSSSVQQALEVLPVQASFVARTVQLTFHYPHESAMRRLLDGMCLEIGEVRYGQRVIFELQVPDGMVEQLTRRVADQTRGEAEISLP